MSRVRNLRLAVSAGVLLVGLIAGAEPAMATSAVPYTDPNSSGFIGLCNQAGQQVTSGSVNAAPFALLAASSVPARPPYNGSGRTATLYAFLPLQGFPPGDWSGETMTAASRFSNPTVPMAAGTSRDPSLSDFIEAYPPKWDGFIQLRLYLDVTNQPAETKHYPTLNIQVTGETWHAVGGGMVNCHAGTATSAEVALAPPTTAPLSTSVTTAPAALAHGGSSPTGTSGAGTHGAAGSNGTSSTTVPATGSASSHASGSQGGRAGGSDVTPRRSSSTSDGLIAGIVAGALVVVGALTYATVRRRRRRRRSRSLAASAAGAEVLNTDESDKVQ